MLLCVLAVFTASECVATVDPVHKAGVRGQVLTEFGNSFSIPRVVESFQQAVPTGTVTS